AGWRGAGHRRIGTRRSAAPFEDRFRSRSDRDGDELRDPFLHEEAEVGGPSPVEGFSHIFSNRRSTGGVRLAAGERISAGGVRPAVATNHHAASSLRESTRS